MRRGAFRRTRARSNATVTARSPICRLGGYSITMGGVASGARPYSSSRADVTARRRSVCSGSIMLGSVGMRRHVQADGSADRLEAGRPVRRRGSGARRPGRSGPVGGRVPSVHSDPRSWSRSEDGVPSVHSGPAMGARAPGAGWRAGFHRFTRGRPGRPRSRNRSEDGVPSVHSGPAMGARAPGAGRRTGFHRFTRGRPGRPRSRPAGPRTKPRGRGRPACSR